MTGEPEFPLTVYYDASCPMCAGEMRLLRDADGEGRLRLVDCSAMEFDEADCAAEGVTRDALMARLHARDADGRWWVAMDAYEIVYRVAGYRWAARIWGARFLRPVLDRAYAWVARNRNVISRMGANLLVRWVLHR